MENLIKAMDNLVDELIKNIGYTSKQNYQRAQVRDIYPDGYIQGTLFSLLDHCIQVRAEIERCK